MDRRKDYIAEVIKDYVKASQLFLQKPRSTALQE